MRKLAEVIDYVTLTGVVDIPAGKKSATVLVKPFNDAIPEPPETITLAVLPGVDYAPSVPSAVTIVLMSADKKHKAK